jgi:hypothetical protein
MPTRYRKSPAKLQRIERLENQYRRLTKFARSSDINLQMKDTLRSAVPEYLPPRRQRSIGIVRAGNGFSDILGVAVGPAASPREGTQFRPDSKKSISHHDLHA